MVVTFFGEGIQKLALICVVTEVVECGHQDDALQINAYLNSFNAFYTQTFYSVWVR